MSLIFYKLTTCFDSKVVGVRPQIYNVGGSIHLAAEDSIYNIRPDRFGKPNLNYLILGENAKLTDILSCAFTGVGLFVNNRVKEILENFNLVEHCFYPAIIKHKQEIFTYTNYYWFHPISSFIHYIDFSRSTFKVCRWVTEIIEVRKFNSLTDFNAFKDQKSPELDLQIDKLVISKDVSTYDYFQINGVNFDWIISERLKRKLIEEEITGYEVNEISWLQVSE